MGPEFDADSGGAIVWRIRSLDIPLHWGLLIPFNLELIPFLSSWEVLVACLMVVGKILVHFCHRVFEWYKFVLVWAVSHGCVGPIC